MSTLLIIMGCTIIISVLYHTISSAVNEAKKSRKKPDQESSTRFAKASEFLMEMGRKNQFEVTELERDDYWVTSVFTYQGGNFICNTGVDNDLLGLHFLHIAELPYTPANYEKVREVCYKYTVQFRNVKVIHSYAEEENILSIKIDIDTVPLTESDFKHNLELCFYLLEVVRQDLDKDITTEEENIVNAREERMLVDAEMAQEAEKIRTLNPNAVSPNNGTLSEYMAYLFNGEQTEDLLLLRVLSAAFVNEIRQYDKIAHFDILGSIVSGEGAEARFATDEPVVLTVETRANHYIFTLHPVKERKEYLTVRMTAVCTPHEFPQDYVPDDTYEPQAFSLLLCYVKSELPEDAEETEALPDTDYTKQVKHGYQLMQQNNFLQAIAVLTPVHKALKIRYFQLSSEEKLLYTETCYFLGFSYSDLRLYDKAYYYLEQIKDSLRSGNPYAYMMEYLVCLTNMYDPRVFEVLRYEEYEKSRMVHEIDTSEDSGTEEKQQRREQLIDFIAFLRRRKGYSQIDFGYLDDAEETFTHLLKHEGSREYAERELDYIKSIRENKS